MGLAALLLVPYWRRPGTCATESISLTLGTPGVHFSRARQAACAFHGRDLDSCCECRRVLSSITLARRAEGSLPPSASHSLDDHQHRQALARERMPFCRPHHLFFPLDWLFVSGAPPMSCVRRLFWCWRPRSGRIFCEKPDAVRFPYFSVSGRISDRSICTLPDLSGSFGFFLRPFRETHCPMPAASHAERERCGSLASTGRAGGSRARRGN